MNANGRWDLIWCLKVKAYNICMGEFFMWSKMSAFSTSDIEIKKSLADEGRK